MTGIRNSSNSSQEDWGHLESARLVTTLPQRKFGKPIDLIVLIEAKDRISSRFQDRRYEVMNNKKED